jgi:hypothetical protein
MKLVTKITQEELINRVESDLKSNNEVFYTIMGTSKEANSFEEKLSKKDYIFQKDRMLTDLVDDTEHKDRSVGYYLYRIFKK